MTTSHWRQSARNVIRRVAAENPDADEGELRQLISNAYPFGERSHYPYQVWLQEVKKFFGAGLGLKAKSVRDFWVK